MVMLCLGFTAATWNKGLLASKTDVFEGGEQIDEIFTRESRKKN